MNPRLELALPRRRVGRQTPKAEAAYIAQLRAWSEAIKRLNATLSFRVGSRGWCYILEPHGLAKGDFDKAEALISKCRKWGLLPLTICAEDASRKSEGEEYLNDEDPEAVATSLIRSMQTAWEDYTPISFWDDQPYYLELLVEKIDLKSLFASTCHEYHIRYGNAKGWASINQLAGMMRRFKQAEECGQKAVLLYCGDHDPPGLAISDFLMGNLTELSGAVGWHPKGRLIIDRFGLNREFIDAHGLTWVEGLETGSGKSLADPEHRNHDQAYVQDYINAHGARKVEANALVVAPEAGRQLLRDTIRKYLAPDAITRYEERLKAPREALRVEMLRQLQATEWKA